MALPAAQVIRCDAKFDTPLVGFRENGHTIHLEGRDSFDRQETYGLKVNLSSGGAECHQV